MGHEAEEEEEEEEGIPFCVDLGHPPIGSHSRSLPLLPNAPVRRSAQVAYLIHRVDSNEYSDLHM